jgi:hypothetical protein
MLSGPDMGGGFLFQLTRERAPAPGFTFHAQEGGSDAGGPPRASPEPLGYTHPANACQYGGPGCWHRSFALPESASARVRVAYGRTRFAMEAMIDQIAGLRPVPAAEGLVEFLDRAAAPLEAEKIPWFLGGSGGAFAQGAALEPHDLDVGTTEAGAARLAELLEDQLIEPLAPEVGPGGSRWTGRAFLGTFRAGVRVEWASVVEAAPAVPREFEGAEVWDRRGKVEWRGRGVWVAPLEFALVRSGERGREEATRRIAEAIVTRGGADRRLLDPVLEASSLSREARERVRRSITPPRDP